ncbi:Sodium/hydrogen exchanger [Aphelenchoides fujianensis]|nr:Sodium/hydrogen exchanger [Aphelenchoides fujianensis]
MVGAFPSSARWLVVVVALFWSLPLGEAYEQRRQNVSSLVLGVNWEHVQSPFLLSCWLLLACVAKILFHVNKKFGDAIPDSALLIAVGLLVGFVLDVFNVNHRVFYLPSEIFFLYLLPPIIFDAGYFMPVRQLFENAGSVLMFSVIGTIWNTVAIGATLALFGYFNFFTVRVTTEDSLLFSSLISAVDPVAVITVFEEIHVNEFLFINTFGEALFNDGIAAVLFQIFKRVALIGIPNLKPLDYLSFGGSFFAVALGGVLIGIVFGLICAIATKYTDRVKIVGPVFVFVIPYLSYLTAEMFGLSAILAICCCGIAMKQYVKGNLSHEAAASVKYFVKMISQSSETVVFMFLGLSTMSADLIWDWWFISVTLVSCLIYRALGVIIQCGILNIFRTKKFTLQDQFVMSYGGLRGAIAFGLLSSVPQQVAARDIFTTTTLVVICFTGTTIRPLLHFLKVETKAEVEETMAENYFDYTMAGIEDIVDQHGGHSFRDWFEHIDAKVIRPILMRNTQGSDYDASTIVRAYHKMAIQDALNGVLSKESTRSGGVTARIGEPVVQEADGTIAVNIEDPTEPNGQQRVHARQTDAALFDMFNELLDRRLAQFRRDSVPDPRDDIRDDYRPAPAVSYSRYQQQTGSTGRLETPRDESASRRQSSPHNLYRVGPTRNSRETKF